MEKTVKAQLKYLHIAPRKTRMMAGLIRGLPVDLAEAQLLLNARRPAQHVLKLLKSAIANAKRQDMKPSHLYVKEIRVDQGPMIKRFMPRAHGAAGEIQKKMSHVTLILGESSDAREAQFIFKEKESKKEKERAKEKVAKKKIQHEADAGAGVKDDHAKKGFLKKVFRRKAV